MNAIVTILDLEELFKRDKSDEVSIYVYTCMLRACMHACIHVHTHTYTHTHAYTHAYTHARTHTHTHTHTIKYNYKPVSQTMFILS